VDGDCDTPLTFVCQPSFEKHARPGRREQFLNTLEAVVPWSELEALIEPYYPKAGKGRQSVGLSVMLRIYFLQHLLEQHDLCGKILDKVNWYLDSKGIRISTGTIVDATIIATPSSTKNNKKERDPYMHRTRMGNQYQFGPKAHIGVDSKEGVVHSVCISLASVHDKHMLPDLLRGDEKNLWGNAGY
jgi:transposase, IS5 family